MSEFYHLNSQAIFRRSRTKIVSGRRAALEAILKIFTVGASRISFLIAVLADRKKMIFDKKFERMERILLEASRVPKDKAKQAKKGQA